MTDQKLTAEQKAKTFTLEEASAGRNSESDLNAPLGYVSGQG